MDLVKVGLRFLFNRQCAPLVLGVCAGITLGLIVVPFLQDDCSGNDLQLFSAPLEGFSQLMGTFSTSEIKAKQISEENTDDYEPRINLAGKPQSAKKEPQTLIRPRYYSTELGIRDKIFVAVLSSIRQIPTLGLAMNATLAHHVNHIAFFVDVVSNEKLDIKTLPIVGFKDSQQGLLTLHTLKYLFDKLLARFNFFFLVKDSTFVNGQKLAKLINHLSITEHVYMGNLINKKKSGSPICSLESGILFSASVLEAVSPLLESCNAEFTHYTDEEKIGLCIYKALNLTCQTNLQRHWYTTFDLESKAMDAKILEEKWESDKRMQNAITLYPAKDPVHYHLLYKLLCATTLKDTQRLIQQLANSIMQVAPQTPGGAESVSWPIGYAPFSKPESRFDVLRWDYFNLTHIFLDTESTVVRPLHGIYLRDIQEVVNISLSRFMETNSQLQFLRLENGYKRLDPTRGMDYILDLAFTDSENNEVIHRLEALRPITRVDTVPMPYVTEASRVYIVLPVWELQQLDAAQKFIEKYATYFMAKSDNTDLSVMLFDSLSNPITSDGYTRLKDLVQNYAIQYKKENSKISVLTFQVKDMEEPSDFAIVDQVAKKLGPESLVFLCSSYSDIHPDLLNRVRINTISGWQIYSPIPFAEYNPNVVFANPQAANEPDISTSHGFYDTQDTWHISFYVADYVNARKMTEESHLPLAKPEKFFINTRPSSYTSILNMFARLGKLHILRAVEPQLRSHYRERKCSNQRCHLSLLYSQGTRSQLTKVILSEESHKLNS